MLGPLLVDVDDLAVEVALLQRHLLVHAVGDLVREAAPQLRGDAQALAVDGAAEHHVPEAELGLLAAIGRLERAADQQRLGADGAPVLEARRLVDVADLLEIGAGVDDLEQAGADEVVGDHLRHLLGRLRVVADEYRAARSDAGAGWPR